jgi:predicted O-methyltransferase YrrM
MFSAPVLLLKYVQYYLKASNGKGHGVHSPFVFDFITRILNDDRTFYAFEQIEQMRANMLTDGRSLTIEDFGAGSRLVKNNQRLVKQIAQSSLKPKKYSQLLFKMVDVYQPKHILELGTSLGITTAYLATANTQAKVITMEGAAAVAEVAKANFEQLQLSNIELVQGNFDTKLQGVLAEQMPSVDFAFVDGNHRYKPTVQYFEQLLQVVHEHSIIVFDDIHWSKEMEAAWHTIINDSAVTLSIDLFFIGIVFFRKENKVKQHFAIRY